MTQKQRTPVPEEDRARILLWSERHCCFCSKSCTTNIVIHHIDGDPSNNGLDNLIPVCFDCHGELEKYNPQHPVGTKYRFLEIKTRRDQIYDKFTLPYVRQAEISISKYTVSGNPRKMGDTSCTVRTLSQDIPIKLKIKIIPYHNNQKMNVELGDIYAGKAIWNINPSQTVFGHVRLPITAELDPFDFRLEIFWSIIDVLEREHSMLPFSFVWNDPIGDWWYDPRVLFKEE